MTDLERIRAALSAKFQAWSAQWPHQIDTEGWERLRYWSDQHDEWLVHPEAMEWLDERSGMGNWDKYGSVYAFKNENDIFEFKMRWK